jgi:hypothetical protein
VKKSAAVFAVDHLEVSRIDRRCDDTYQNRVSRNFGRVELTDPQAVYCSMFVEDSCPHPPS